MTEELVVSEKLAMMEELADWKVTFLSDLVLKVLQQQSRPKHWRDVATCAEFVYEQKRDYWHKSDDRLQKNDNFVNQRTILTNRHRIRQYLESQGVYIDWLKKGRNAKNGAIHLITDPAAITGMFALREKMVVGRIRTHNGSVDELAAHRPSVAEGVNRLEVVEQNNLGTYTQVAFDAVR